MESVREQIRAHTKRLEKIIEAIQKRESPPEREC